MIKHEGEGQCFRWMLSDNFLRPCRSHSQRPLIPSNALAIIHGSGRPVITDNVSPIISQPIVCPNSTGKYLGDPRHNPQLRSPRTRKFRRTCCLKICQPELREGRPDRGTPRVRRCVASTHPAWHQGGHRGQRGPSRAVRRRPNVCGVPASPHVSLTLHRQATETRLESFAPAA